MKLSSFPFSVSDFSSIEPEVRNGTTGTAEWRVTTRDDIRIRLVTYSPGYFADHWCSKGHIIYCVEGAMTTELKDGRQFELKQGMLYTVGDDSDAHRSFSEKGCTLFIVD